MTTNRVRLSRKPATDEVVCQPAGFLPQGLYDALGGVVERFAGWKSTGTDGKPAHSFPLTALPDVAEGLKAAGVEIDLTTDLVAVVRARAEAAKSASATSDARILRIRETLAARGEALRPYQEVTVQFLMDNRKCLLADDMGVGKTAPTILAVPRQAAVIWVTKVSLVNDAMASFARWHPRLGQGSDDLTRWPAPATFSVTTYGRLPEKPPEGGVQHPVVLVADEAKALKGTLKVGCCARFQAWSDAVGALPDSYRWLLEGTPVMNRLDELWNLLERVGLAHELFASRSRFRKLAKEDRDQLVRVLRRVILRRDKDEVWPDMPRTTRSQHRVTISDEDRLALDACLEEIRQLAATQAADKLRAADPAVDEAALAKAREKAYASVAEAIKLAFDGQVPVPLDLISRVKSILSTAKSRHSVAFLRDLVPDMGSDGKVNGRPMLFFSEHVRPVHEVSAAIPGAELMTGETPQAERAAIVARFKAGKTPLLCLTGKVGGEGLNLPEASTGVWNDKPWNYALVNQQEDRMRRFGQTDDRVQAISVTTDHVLDARIDELITEKQILSQSTVGRTTIRGSGQDPERPDSLARALDNVLTLGRETANVVEEPHGPRTERQRFVAGVVLYHRAKLASGFAKPLAEDLKRSGLTPSQWRTADAVVATRVEETPDFRRGPVTQEERDAAKHIAGYGREWRDFELDLRRNLDEDITNGGLTEGRWALAAFVTRKYRSAK